MTVLTFLLFLACVGLSAYCQNLTGFAFALLLLGMVGAFGLMPIPEAANVASVLSLANAWAYWRYNRVTFDWPLLRPILISSLLGVLGGVALLAWLSANAVTTLRLLLGVAIIGCSILLLVQAAPRSQPSGKPALWFFGVLSGLLGGLFSTSGPPMVYHLYRQPLDRDLVRECLFMMFAASAALRLVLVSASGHFEWRSLLLGVCAVPVVAGVSWWQAKHPPPISRRTIEWLVCALLMLAGASLIWASLNN
ncbi:MAG: sulfite exporter TauE/SafE family protein [Alcaligenaceae bacterium]|nr:sulfite exporter TauE/SafE family protein [Alcaligenaceae bacterium SAGV5]MPS54628.1 sulfite exporter TauE/SafE family protein [Alcaligenaceae bacterium SAGV3]MPT56999.1 sulfite exporter TauE/SafE family protein [Alcaligenaceae bacterium]